jgi:hypothetical protein
MIFLSTDTQHLSRMIHSLIHNVIQVQTPTGKFPFLSGLLFFIVLTRVNRSEKLQGIMACRMRQYAVLLTQHARKQVDVFILPSSEQVLKHLAVIPLASC